MDEFVSTSFNEYDGVPIKSLCKEGTSLLNEEEMKKLNDDNKEFLDFVKNSIGNRVMNVKISGLLNETPCVLTTSQFGPSANLEKLFKSQAISNNNMPYSSMKILELNLKHKTIDFIRNQFKQNDKYCNYLINLLFNCALIDGGFHVENTKSVTGQFVDFVNLNIESYLYSEQQQKQQNQESA
jgi:molecular chaperone HtpG